MNNSKSHLVLFYFFDFRDASKQNLKDLIASLLFQLLESECKQEVFPPIKKLYESHELSNSNPRNQEWIATFQEAIHLIKKEALFIVIDALDEIQREALLPFYEFVQQLHGTLGNHLHLLLTSRPQLAHSHYLEQLCLQSGGVVLMSKENINNDVKVFLDHTMQNDIAFRSHSPQEKMEIQDRLVEKADGMYV